MLVNAFKHGLAGPICIVFVFVFQIKCVYLYSKLEIIKIIIWCLQQPPGVGKVSCMKMSGKLVGKF